MEERDCVLCITELKPFLVEFLKIAESFGISYFSWDNETGRIVPIQSKKKPFVQVSIACHAIYVLCQVYVTFEMPVSVASKLIASSIIGMIVLTLAVRWEFHPDEVPMQLINELFAKDVGIYLLRRKGTLIK